MIYTARQNLTILSLSHEKDSIEFTNLRETLLKVPNNIIYIELNNLLYGIISMGDINKANLNNDESVQINKLFTFISTSEYMKARQIFKDNININNLPIVNNDGKLIGEYSRWDDLIYLKNAINFLPAINYEQLNCIRISFVLPSPNSTIKKDILNKWIVKLTPYLTSIEFIEKNDLSNALENFDNIIFIDENELITTTTLYESLLHKKFSRGKCVTLKQFIERLINFTDTQTIKSFFKHLQKQGINILTIGCEENENSYLKIFNQKIDNKFNKLNIPKTLNLLPPMKNTFLHGIFDEKYSKQSLPFKLLITTNSGTYNLKDQSTQLFNVKNGERCTINQPSNYNNCIYMFGPCIITGSYVEDKHTIASYLQEKINSSEFNYKIVNLGTIETNPIFDIKKILQTPLQDGDIIIWATPKLNLAGYGDFHINLTDIFEKNNISENWVIDNIWHTNYKSNNIIANTIYDTILPSLKKGIHSHTSIIKNDNFMIDDYINKYFSNFNKNDYKTIGSIVMNCNPFTFGHRYLIETALKQVDFLIIFVVEEDKSLFTFNERFAMVCNGVSDLNNILIVPSGDFILSQTTFPEYFLKITDEDLINNVEFDITLFSKKIAPKLNITHRFVGEEPEDIVTKEYNNAMRKILPNYQIKFIEIPRKKNYDNIISASFVRKCLTNGDVEQLNLLIPESSKQILFMRNE